MGVVDLDDRLLRPTSINGVDQLQWNRRQIKGVWHFWLHKSNNAVYISLRKAPCKNPLEQCTTETMIRISYLKRVLGLPSPVDIICRGSIARIGVQDVADCRILSLLICVASCWRTSIGKDHTERPTLPSPLKKMLAQTNRIEIRQYVSFSRALNLKPEFVS